MKQRIAYTGYINRVHGCRLGKCIGGAIGASDFMNTMMIARHCGGDGARIYSTAGAILGIHHAATGLMNRYDIMDRAFKLGVNTKRRSDRICDLAEDVARIGIAISPHNDAVVIKGGPKPVKIS